MTLSNDSRHFLCRSWQRSFLPRRPATASDVAWIWVLEYPKERQVETYGASSTRTGNAPIRVEIVVVPRYTTWAGCSNGHCHLRGCRTSRQIQSFADIVFQLSCQTHASVSDGRCLAKVAFDVRHAEIVHMYVYNLSMKKPENMRELEYLASSQWGMFTATRLMYSGSDGLRFRECWALVPSSPCAEVCIAM